MKYEKQKRWRERNKERVAANKRRYRQTDEYKIIHRNATVKYGANIRDNLTDKYIVGLLVEGEKVNREIYYNNKPLIELKRSQIKLIRCTAQYSTTP